MRRGAAALAAWAALAGAAHALDLGTIGDTCPARLPSLPAGVSSAPLPAPRGVRVLVVADPACPATPRALEALRTFRHTHPDAEIVLLLTDPAAFRALQGERLAAALDTGGVPYTWNPGYLRALAPRAVPWVRIDTPSGRTVTAAGTPDLAAMLERAR